MFHLAFEVGTRQCKPRVYSLHLQRNTRMKYHTGSVSDTSDRRFDDWIVIDENSASVLPVVSCENEKNTDFLLSYLIFLQIRISLPIQRRVLKR